MIFMVDIQQLTKLVQGLTQQPQLPFTRLNFKRGQTVAESHSQRLKLPQYMTDIISNLDSIELIPVSGSDSFLQCLIKVLTPQRQLQLPDQNEVGWLQVQQNVKYLREKLLKEFEVQKAINPTLKNMNETLTKSGLSASTGIIPAETKYYIASFFGVNLYVIDNRMVEVFYKEPKFVPHKASVAFYETDDGLWYCLSVADSVLSYSESTLIQELAKTVHDDLNQFQPPTPKTVKIIDPQLKKLMKMSLSDLQDLCIAKGISIKKAGTKGNLINCKKDELIKALGGDLRSP